MPSRTSFNALDEIETALAEHSMFKLREPLSSLADQIPENPDLIEPLLATLEQEGARDLDPRHFLYPILAYLDEGSDQQKRAIDILCHRAETADNWQESAQRFRGLMAEAAGEDVKKEMVNAGGPEFFRPLFEHALQGFKQILASIPQEDELKLTSLSIESYGDCLSRDQLYAELHVALRERLESVSDPMTKVKIIASIATSSYIPGFAQEDAAYDFKAVVDDLPDGKQRLEQFRKAAATDKGSYRLTQYCAEGILENIIFESDLQRCFSLITGIADKFIDDPLLPPLMSCLDGIVEQFPTERERLLAYQKAQFTAQAGSSYDEALLLKIIEKAMRVPYEVDREESIKEVIDLSDERGYPDIKKQALTLMAENLGAFPDRQGTEAPSLYVLEKSYYDDPCRNPLLERVMKRAQTDPNKKLRTRLLKEVAIHARLTNPPLATEALDQLLDETVKTPNDEEDARFYAFQFVAEQPGTARSTRLLAMQGLLDTAEVSDNPSRRHTCFQTIVELRLPSLSLKDAAADLFSRAWHGKKDPFSVVKQKALSGLLANASTFSERDAQNRSLEIVITHTSKRDPLHQKALDEQKMLKDGEKPAPLGSEAISRFLKNLKGLKGDKNTRG